MVVGKLDGGSIIRQVKRAMRGASTLPVYSFSGPKLIPGIDWSDHLNYWNVGYKAVMVSDTAIYRNANYHTAQDTANTLDYHRMAMVVQGVYQPFLRLTLELALGVVVGAQAGAAISRRTRAALIIRLLAIALGLVGLRLLFASA